MTWDKNALKQEVESFADDKEFSWRELGCRYNVMNKSGELAKNGGQIIKQWLLHQSVNTARFTNIKDRKSPVIRCRKRVNMLGMYSGAECSCGA